MGIWRILALPSSYPYSRNHSCSSTLALFYSQTLGPCASNAKDTAPFWGFSSHVGWSLPRSLFPSRIKEEHVARTLVYLHLRTFDGTGKPDTPRPCGWSSCISHRSRTSSLPSHQACPGSSTEYSSGSQDVVVLGICRILPKSHIRAKRSSTLVCSPHKLPSLAHSYASAWLNFQ